MNTTPTLTEWQLVPSRIAEVLPHAAAVKLAHEQAALKAGILAISAATWSPELNAITLYSAEQFDKRAYDIYEKEIYDGERCLASVSYNAVQPDWNEEILVKRGSLVPGLPTVWNAGNKMLGGPSPLSNGIMTSLLAGGAGYGAGMLAEQFFPSRYMERGKLRRTLGMIGALGGLGVAGVNSYANASALRTSMLKGLFTNHKTPVVYPYETKMEKQSYPYQSPMFAPTVSVPQFNSAAWQDVNRGLYSGFQNHTPPQYAAATTGLMTGISTSMGAPIIRPIDVVRGIASAGIGLATATIAGKALSALAGLTPEGQNKLQEMGLWGGMMHAMVPTLFGR